MVGALCLFALLRWQTNLSVPVSLGLAALFGIAAGGGKAYHLGREHAAVRSDVAEVVPHVPRRAERVVRGEAPRDEPERAAAFRLAMHRADARHPAGSAVVLGLAVVSQVFLALVISPWLWIGVGLILLAATADAQASARMRRRAEELLAPLAQSSTRSFSPPE